jgi:16S rRNA (guanine966-N2)-methyltransferase
MRIIAGQYKSRRLNKVPSKGTRPTSDKLRETMFNILGGRVIESDFMDAYAGVGAIGIEAISRGARSVYFVDRATQACAAIRTNLESLNVEANCRVLRMECGEAFGLCLREGAGFDIVFLDPPYEREELYRRDLERLGANPLLKTGAVVVTEHLRSIGMPANIPGLVHLRTHPQGDSALTFYEPEGE